MSKGLNTVTLLGNLGQNVELKDNGVAKVSLATTSSRKDKRTGEWIDKTQWHALVMFGKTAEAAAKYLRKGSSICITGTIEYNKFEKDGQVRYYTNILVNNLLMLDKKNDATQATAHQQYQPQQQTAKKAAAWSNEDVPF